MALTPLYTNESVFKSAKINSICDQLERLVQKYIDENRTSDFCLYGDAAQILEGTIPVKQVSKIQFITGYNRIFRIFIEKISKEMSVNRVEFFVDLVVITVDDIYIEILKSPNVIKTKITQNISVYDYGINAQDGQDPDPDGKPGDSSYTTPIVVNPNFDEK